jgi:hypothetical protein
LVDYSQYYNFYAHYHPPFIRVTNHPFNSVEVQIGSLFISVCFTPYPVSPCSVHSGFR